MDVNIFFNEFTMEIDRLLEEGVFIGLSDVNELEDGTFTLLFDVAIYNIAKKNKLTLIPESPTGRGGYSDMTLCSSDGKTKLIEIEHENRPLRKKSKKIAIYKSLDNLMLSKAKSKLLVTYTFNDINQEELKKMCIEYLNKKYLKRNGTYLFFAPSEFNNAKKEFEKIEL